MEEQKSKKQIVLELINDFKSDSKTKSKKAEQEIISICEPRIKEFYKIAQSFEVTNDDSFTWRRSLPEWDNDYVARRGNIDYINYVEVDDEKQVISFYYSDGCRGNIYDADIEMPLEWLDDETLDKYKEHCREFALSLINEHHQKLQKQITELDEKQKELSEK